MTTTCPAVSRGVRVLLALALGGLLPAAACQRRADTEPPVATPGFAVNRPSAALGSPVEITYRFDVAADAPPLTQNYRVMVHFLDSDDELLWTDDHDPPVPTTRWKPGERVEYVRTVFIPVFPYVGPVTVRMGLYSTQDGRRLPLSGEAPEQRSYKVATIDLVPRPEEGFIVFKDGWHAAEVAHDNPAVEWQWSRRQATLSFRNPRRDAVLYLHLDGRPDLVGRPQQVTLRIGEAVVDTFEVATREEIVRKVPIAAAQFGEGEAVDLGIEVSETFVPARIPAADSRDSRELGIRLFHVYLEPK
jgi:hypothetical protein